MTKTQVTGDCAAIINKYEKIDLMLCQNHDLSHSKSNESRMNEERKRQKYHDFVHATWGYTLEMPSNCLTAIFFFELIRFSIEKFLHAYFVLQ